MRAITNIGNSTYNSVVLRLPNEAILWQGFRAARYQILVFTKSVRMDSSTQEVTVCSSTNDDFQHVQQLLKSINRRIRIVASQNMAGTGCCPNDVSTDVMIVCHRFGEQTPMPCLPKGKIPPRLIVLSDCDTEQTIVDTLENGAHHYFNISEPDQILAARLAAAMRNHHYHSIDVLEVFPFKFFVERRKVTHNDKLIHLSPREFALAYFLFSNSSRVVHDTELMVSIWTLPSSMDSRRIDTAICRIRKKMDLYENASGWNLQRLRQVGYQLLYDNSPESPNYLPDLSKCLLAPKTVSVHDQTASVAAGSTSCKVLASNSTISDSSMSLAINGGASRT